MSKNTTKYTIGHFLFLVLILLSAIGVAAQPKQLNAVRVDHPILIDGKFDDWPQTAIATDFVQNEPNPGAPSNFRTTASLVYDDDAIYIAATVYDTMELVRTDLTPRDQRLNADWFGVLFDTYKNGLNAVSFAVTAAGVQIEEQWSNDFNDSNWNAVWHSEVAHFDDRWQVEFAIPYAALRFSEQDVHEWYLQFARYIRRNREFSHWNYVDPKINGVVQQSGVVTGIKDVEPPLRLSLTPFIGANHTQNASGINDTNFTGGMDLKYGITDAFTLDAILIPDFSQVLADDQVVNLSPFEVFFEERRQFFTEGVELFSRANIFYSRRIGGGLFRQAEASEIEGIGNLPSQARLLNATKVSGRFKNGNGFGVFNAIEASEKVKLPDTDEEYEVHPLTNYNVTVFDLALKNNSYISLINTNTLRTGSAYDANVTASEFQLRDKDQMFQLDGTLAVSQIYDQDANDYGHTLSLAASDIKGKFVSTLGYNEESARYNPNDLGFLFSPNERFLFGEATYQQFEPQGIFNSYRIWAFSGVESLYEPFEYIGYNINLGGFAFTKKFFAFGHNMGFNSVRKDFFEPRTFDFEQYYLNPASLFLSPFISTDYSKKFAIDVRMTHIDFLKSVRRRSSLSIRPRWQVNSNTQLITEFEIVDIANREGYINKNTIAYTDIGLEESQVMFGNRNRRTITNSILLNYIISNRISTDLRIRHYWDRISYDQYFYLNSDGSLTDIEIAAASPDSDNPFDGNFNFFNVDFNFIWRFAPGSDIIFSYKNNAFSPVDFDGYYNNLSGVFSEGSNHLISLKVLYFLDVNKIVK